MSKGKSLSFERVGQLETDRNFNEIKKAFFELGPAAMGLPTADVALVVGDNAVSVPIRRPSGRILLYQSAAADLFDKGLNSDGKWVINASAACTVRLLFIP